MNRDKQPMTLAPIKNQLIDFDGGALISDALMNRRYGCTVNDGSYAEVEVADATVESLGRPSSQFSTLCLGGPVIDVSCRLREGQKNGPVFPGATASRASSMGR